MAGGTISVADWNKILANKGEPITRKASTAKITDRYGREKDDPYPAVTYTFKDGSSITMKGIPSAESGPDSVSWNVLDQKGIFSDPKDATSNRVLVSGSNPSDQYIITTDGQGNTVTEKNPNYVPPKAPNTVPGTGSPGSLDGTGGTPDLPVDVYNAQTERQRAEDARRQAAASAAAAGQKFAYDQLQQNADNEYRRLALQVQQGQLSNSQAIEQFNEYWKQNVELPKTRLDAQAQLYNTGQSAGMDAAKLAQMGTEGMVGPGFGGNFADALTGLATGDRSKVHFGAGDFTYQIPDYGAIAKNAAAAAIAHLSPYAASIAGTAAPSGYQPPTQQPGVVAAAANSVVAPNPSPVQPPPYRPAGVVG